MTTRTLRRRTLMREYDYNKIKAQALHPRSEYGGTRLYDRSNFILLDQAGLEKLRLVEILKGKDSPINDYSLDLNQPAMLLYKLKDFLYDERYYNWNVSLDEQGCVCIQARANTPKSKIGMATFEKDLGCKV